MDEKFDAALFVDRYTAVWNEPDPSVRHAMVAELWAEDGVEFTELGEYRGHAALEARIAEAQEQFVRQGGFVFRPAGDVVAHHGGIRFTNYMVPAGGGEIAWAGAVFVIVDGDGRIRQDYQFGDPPAAAVAMGLRPGTRAVVEEYLARSRGGDADRIAEMYAPQFDFRVNWPNWPQQHPVVPWIRPRSTRADLVDHYRTFAAHCLLAEGQVSVDDIVVDGSEAILIGTSTQRVKSTGKPFAMTFALRLTVENGLITRHHMYEDSLAVVEAFSAD